MPTKKKKPTKEPEAFEKLETPPEVQETPDPEAKYNEMLDRYQRCLAEFDNFRKRTAKEMSERHSDGIRAACEKLLPLADNFERALAAHDNKEDNFFKGIEMIARQFDNTLSEMGVESIPAEPGVPFDINVHYAVAHSTDENLGENTIADVLQKGYFFKERVLRPVMVKVAN
ncbi:MAG: nucleotide exchange factor GrpE [Defluviitaleaceae bacterium]|nr:nucleotide exchange factor GrpE [Defluviitaleaceae bacterium]